MYYIYFRMLIFQLFSPLLQMLLFHYAFGQYPTNLQIGIVNEEWPNVVDCPTNFNNNCTTDDLLSCDYYHLLKPFFKLVIHILIKLNKKLNVM